MAVHLVQSVCTAVAVLLPVLRFASRRYGPVQGRHAETLSAAFVSYEIHLASRSDNEVRKSTLN